MQSPHNQQQNTQTMSNPSNRSDLSTLQNHMSPPLFSHNSRSRTSEQTVQYQEEDEMSVRSGDDVRDDGRTTPSPASFRRVKVDQIHEAWFDHRSEQVMIRIVWKKANNNSDVNPFRVLTTKLQQKVIDMYKARVSELEHNGGPQEQVRNLRDLIHKMQVCMLDNVDSRPKPRRRDAKTQDPYPRPMSTTGLRRSGSHGSIFSLTNPRKDESADERDHVRRTRGPSGGKDDLIPRPSSSSSMRDMRDYSFHNELTLINSNPTHDHRPTSPLNPGKEELDDDESDESDTMAQFGPLLMEAKNEIHGFQYRLLHNLTNYREQVASTISRLKKDLRAKEEELNAASAAAWKMQSRLARAEELIRTLQLEKQQQQQQQRETDNMELYQLQRQIPRAPSRPQESEMSDYVHSTLFEHLALNSNSPPDQNQFSSQHDQPLYAATQVNLASGSFSGTIDYSQDSWPRQH